MRPDGNGGLLRHHDPAIAEAYRPWRLGSIAMWDLWDKVRCPTLLLRGADFDLLLADTARRDGPARRQGGADRVRWRRPSAGADDARSDRPDRGFSR